MKMRELLQSQASLSKLAGLKLPALAAYNVAKTLKQVSAEMEAFEAARLAILKSYGTLNVEAQRYDVPPEAHARADADFQALLDTELGDFKPLLLKLEWLPDGELSAADLLALDWLIAPPQ